MLDHAYVECGFRFARATVPRLEGRRLSDSAPSRRATVAARHDS